MENFPPAPKEPLLDVLRRIIAAEPTVRWAYLFGSAARGGTFADLDVAIMLERDSSLLVLGRLAADLEAATAAPVDVVDLQAASPMFVLEMLQRPRILIVDREPGSRCNWESLQASIGLDMLPAFSAVKAAWREQMRRGGDGGAER